MRQQLTQRPSPKQLNALLTLYRTYVSQLSACGSSSLQRGRGTSIAPCLQAEKEGRDAKQLALPLFGHVESERTARLAWASEILGREVSSFTALCSDEAALLIDTLKRALGQKVTPPRRRPGRDQAFAYGTAGRRNQVSNEIQLVDEATLDLIAHLAIRLGWTVERFDVFLLSPSSPVRSGAIRTLAEANRIIWALKNMLRHQEKGFYRSKREDKQL